MRTSTNYYENAFWKTMRQQPCDAHDLHEGQRSDGAFAIPARFTDVYTKALEQENLFRRFGTVVNAPVTDGKIIAIRSGGDAFLVNENETIPESNDAVSKETYHAYKLASITRLREEFVRDNHFDLQGYLSCDFARRFGRAEEKIFLNGTGEKQPFGLLHDEKGAQIGATAGESISYDNIVRLYHALKPEYRRKAVWIMHDDTAMALRMLKDENGTPLWNHANDAIFGRPVVTSLYMPKAEAGCKPILFGDLSYFWMIEHDELSVKPLYEHYIMEYDIGYVAYERLDGRLIRAEAVQALAMPTAAE